MPLQARNQSDVPREDLPYFIAATTAGIRRQLREAEIPSGGLKYDLYLRLRANGLRIYNDERGALDPESSDESDRDDDDEDEDERGDGESESGESDDDESDDDESSDSDVPPSRGRSRKKRKREDGEADVEDGIEEPEAPKPTSLADMPAEMAINIIRNLDAGGVFNLAAASPQRFLDGNVNAFVLEAKGRRSAASRNGLSLLEWVVARVGNEVDFRTDYKELIQCVVDAYLQAYPSNSPQERSEEARVEEIMVYLRQVGVNPVLTSAIVMGEADVVQLLILLGEDVNQREDNISPLEESTVGVRDSLLHMNRLLIVFALLAAGADNTSTREDWPQPDSVTAGFPSNGVAAVAENRLSRIMQRPLWSPVMDEPKEWPVIQNPRDLTIRQFLGDERSPLLDRAILALVVIITRKTVYPYFEGYDPNVEDTVQGSPVA